MNRRSFMRSAATAAVGLQAEWALPKASAEEAASESAPQTKSSRLALVNVLQGTRSTYLFSRGNTLPIVARPFGMAHWTLQTVANTPWFFHPDDNRLQGIRCTHQLSPWLSDYGYATLMPIDGTADAGAGSRSSSYRPTEATLTPAEISIELLRYQAKVELTPTLRGAHLRVSFAEPQPNAGFAIDLPGADAEGRLDATTRTFHGSTSATAGGTPKNFRTYYCIHFGETHSPLKLEEHADKAGKAFVVRYAATAGQTLALRVATSFISAEQAQHNLETEVAHNSFEAALTEAQAEWESCFARAVVQGGTEAQQRVFYSAMYRALLFPRTWHELDAAGKPIHFSAFNGKVEPGVMYADHGYWDVYRAWYPWMSILFPEKLGEILQAWVNAAHEGGWLPQFPSPGYRACMTGSLIDAVFADAAVKQVPGFDLAAAYEYLHKHATTPGDPDAGYGRRGIEQYLKLGYCPEGIVDQSAAETVDSAYGDFCLAQIAGLLNKDADRAMFLKRSENWKHLFNAATGFLRGKTADGKWVEPFDPIRWGSPYVEGAAWQHRWDVPHEPEQLFEAMGGKGKAAVALEQMITIPPDFHIGTYGQEIHEMSEMAAVHFGQYAHSNQPVHHVLYLFALAGRPDRTQYWVRRVMEDLYTPDSFAGDEDTGSMAAWFLLSACGFYPACAGKPEYVMGAPLFDQVILNLPNGRKLAIVAEGNGPDKRFVRGCKWNGEVVTVLHLQHEALMQGGVLEFSMTASAKNS